MRRGVPEAGLQATATRIPFLPGESSNGARTCKCPPCRNISPRLDCAALVFVFVILLLQLPSSVSGTAMGEDCDWFGSGQPGPAHGVSPVYLRCAQGRLRWAYPRGALRVLLRLGGGGADFRGCVRLRERSAGARLYLEGARSLVPFFEGRTGVDADVDTNNDVVATNSVGPRRRLARCFRSRAGQGALYVESLPAPPGDFTKRVLEFTYDLEPLPRGSQADDPVEQCRPCSKDEMSYAFCTSDLVARGVIGGVRDKPELDVTELTVWVSQVLRRSAAGDEVEEGDNVTGTTTAVQVPLQCGARRGAGEFVFMARRRLGALALTCAPRVRDWAATTRELQATGDAHCVLST